MSSSIKEKEAVFKKLFLFDKYKKHAEVVVELKKEGFNIEKDQLGEIRKELVAEREGEIGNIKRVRGLYNNKKGVAWGFGSFESFYKWNKDQGTNRKCFYCGLSEEKSKDYYDYLEKNGIRKKGKKGWVSTRGLSLEIDRKDNNGQYNKDNCVLACYYCNNAKSDVFKWEEFKKEIGPKIKKVIKARIAG